MEVLKFIWENWMPLLGGLSAAFAGLLALALVIPGEQPDKFLQNAVDLLKKLSKK